MRRDKIGVSDHKGQLIFAGMGKTESNERLDDARHSLPTCAGRGSNPVNRIRQLRKCPCTELVINGFFVPEIKIEARLRDADT